MDCWFLVAFMVAISQAGNYYAAIIFKEHI